ncbi:hypothetical protein KY320_01905, partial [Candidatus Woesearchaeota archaeon]|nr:hypothetical protein [Candidatus Woesearchaeota archaeon]
MYWMLKTRLIALAFFAITIFSLSLVAADGPKIAKIGPVSLTPFSAEDIGIFKLYDFVCENDIEAYQCRLGPHPADFPDYFDEEICNREFLDITQDERLDWPDEQAVGGLSWTNYATHHFFVLEDVDGNKLKRFAVGYVTYNKYHDGEEHHYLYVKNFATNEWELLDDTYVLRYEQGLLGHISDFGDKSNYVNSESEMWFMGTEGAHSG